MQFSVANERTVCGFKFRNNFKSYTCGFAIESFEISIANFAMNQWTNVRRKIDGCLRAERITTTTTTSTFHYRTKVSFSILSLEQSRKNLLRDNIRRSCLSLDYCSSYLVKLTVGLLKVHIRVPTVNVALTKAMKIVEKFSP